MPPVIARSESTDLEQGPFFDWDPVIGLEVSMDIITNTLSPMIDSMVEKLRESLLVSSLAENIEIDKWVENVFSEEVNILQGKILSQLAN
jgi:hypothetical protein